MCEGVNVKGCKTPNLELYHLSIIIDILLI